MKTTDAHLAPLREALKHYNDPEWLGLNSPLATPYFLGSHLASVDRPETVTGRGEALRKAIFQAATNNWPGNMPQSRQALWNEVEAERSKIGHAGPRYRFLMLDLRYLRRYHAPRTWPSTVGAMQDFMGVSGSTYHRHRNEAIKDLMAALLNITRPSLRLEWPVLPAPLVGREAVLAGCMQALEEGQSVTISGAGGIGKSSLGTALFNAWPEGSSFWYTFRPGINDDLSSVLFMLGHFLNEIGRPGLWLHLMTTDRKPDSVAQALGFLREDLELSGQGSLLLCFDEVDLLQTGASQPRHGVHKQVLELLEALCSLSPVLLIGQRALIDTHAHFALQPLTEADVSTMQEQAGIPAEATTPEIVHRATEGNPRLVELFLTLANTGDETTALNLRRKPAVRPLFSRLWKRLSQDEKQVLAALSVFRSYAPRNEWADQTGLFDLERRQLIKADASDGIALLPAFRKIVYDELPQEQRQELHRRAAIVRTTFGQYTAAAHHYCRAGEIEKAIDLWYTVQDIETQQGNAGAAHALFNDIPVERVKGRRRRQLRVIQNRLNLQFAQLESVLDGMDSYSWHVDEELSATAYEQWGEAHRLMGDLDAARARYDDAIAVLGRLSNQIVNLHVKRGHAWLLEADHAGAEREAALAQHEVERYRSVIAIHKGQHRQAQRHLNEALQLARSAEDERREAQANYLLAVTAGNLGEIEVAHEHAAEATAYFERVGDRLNQEGLRAELAGIYLNVGRFDEVIEPAERALSFFEKIKHSHWPGHISSNLAEAYFETGDLEKAEVYARRAINTENPPVQPYAYFTLGQVFQKNGNPDSAEHSFQIGLQIAEQNEDRFIAAYLHRVYGEFLRSMGRDQEASNQLGRSLELFSQLDIAHELEKTRQLMEHYGAS